jgi:hypothetical protein
MQQIYRAAGVKRALTAPAYDASAGETHITEAGHGALVYRVPSIVSCY